MKLVGKVPVEPLDDERLTNIERRLVVRVSEMGHQQHVRAPRRLLAVSAIACAVMVAGIVGWKLRGDGTPAVAPAPEQLAMTGGALDLGDAQITGSDFTVTRTATRVDIAMKPGKLDLHVEHKPERLFVVHAGNVEIEDVGTRFSVDYDGANVDVRVTEGEVKVKHAGKELSIVAGNAWTIELGPIAIAQLEAAHSQVAAADVPAHPVQPAQTAQTQPDSSTHAGSSAGSTQGSGARPKAGKTNGRKALEAVEITPPIDVGTSNPREAIIEYSKRASEMGSGQDTSRMLYSMAVVQHRANDDKAALRTLQGVTRRQGGDAYQDGMWLEVRIKCLQAFDEECRRAAERYRQKFTSGQATGAADAVLGEIYRR